MPFPYTSGRLVPQPPDFVPAYSPRLLGQISVTKLEFATQRLRRLRDRNAGRMCLDRGIGCGGALPIFCFLHT